MEENIWYIQRIKYSVVIFSFKAKDMRRLLEYKNTACTFWIVVGVYCSVKYQKVGRHKLGKGPIQKCFLPLSNWELGLGYLWQTHPNQ